jgi:hypothetical protein
MRIASIRAANAADRLRPKHSQKDTTMNDHVIDQAELTRLGIERVHSEIFHWGGYRYSNARDAIAAARRGEKK